MSPALIGIIAVIALAAVALIIIGQRRTRLLREKFGPEYEETLKSLSDRGRAEAELRKREARMEKLTIRPLAAADRTRFEQTWQADQARFVDDPRAAVKEADRLVADLMQVRGYPVGDFGQRAADVSVDHPHVVSEYRAAHDIAERDARGEASTEDLRNAMIHYRALFQDLLVVEAPSQETSGRSTTTERLVADRSERSATTDRVVADRAQPSTTPDRIIPDRDEGAITRDRIIPDRDDATPGAR
jgi:hypothetical protein